MKKIMKEAHRMTREMKGKYPEVDYQAQLGLNISYLLEGKEEKEMELPKMEGTKKQIEYANDIKKEIISILEEMKKYSPHNERTNKKIEEVRNETSAYRVINSLKYKYETKQLEDDLEFSKEMHKEFFQ